MAPNRNTVKFSEVFAQRMREVRERERLSQADLADRLASAGVPIGRATLAKIEAGGTRRDNLTVDEVMAICSVLGIAPIYALTPTGLSPQLEVTSEVTLDPVEARHWMNGMQALSESSARTYFSEVADSAYAARQRTGVMHLLGEVQAFVDAAGADDSEAMAERLEAIGRELGRQRDELDRLNARVAKSPRPRKG